MSGPVKQGPGAGQPETAGLGKTLEIGREWAGSKRNRQWAHPLEGRTIWSHCLWIGNAVQALPGSFTPSGEHGPACCRGADLPQIASVHTEVGSFTVYGERLAGERTTAVLSAGLSLLADTQHLSLPVLSGGRILLTNGRPHDHPVLVADESWDADQCSVDLLAVSSGVVLRAWYAVLEEHAADSGAPQPIRAFEPTAQLLAACLEFEHCMRRLEMPLDGALRRGLVERRDRVGEFLFANSPDLIFTDSPNESIVAELVSYHYPYWNRSYFPFHSPWDTWRVKKSGGGIE
ncbi:hypothetical protein [Kitasatospora kifunensis]|uniref:Uncharacterized protein n=1 Tax=Kitasatospora kifunensis TaxID=58351 RepID=A0A7W7R875_KITKI|nr:hypothetical protein [Kitasatospora kifunensis]MBB4926918.1 hypothetical protein [Kitasatospora kifunensis]